MRSRDVVFCLAPKVGRQELQYALRSLNLIPHGRVFVVGGKPEWVVNVEHVPFDVKDKWMALTRVWDVFRSLPLTSEFIYTEDDYFITEPCDDIPNYHQGPLFDKVDPLKKRWATPSWSGSLKATYDLLVANGITQPLSFDVHIPMVVQHGRIPDWPSKLALRYRDLVGNTATRPAVKIARDVKVATPGSLKKVHAAGIGFLSSSDRTFTKSGVQAALEAVHPEPCLYEKEYYVGTSPFEPESPYDEPASPRAARLEAKKSRIIQTRIRRNEPPRVLLETGEWIAESDYEAGDEEE